MPFDLSTALAVREREDGLLEKDTFDLSTAKPVTEIRAAKPGEIPYRPELTGEQRQQAIVERMYLEKGEKLPIGLKIDWALQSREAEAGSSTAVTFGLYPLVQGVRGFLDTSTQHNVIDRIFRGIYEPEKTKRVVEHIPGIEKLPTWAKVTANIADDFVSYIVVGKGISAVKRSLVIRGMARDIDTAANSLANEQIEILMSKKEGVIPSESGSYVASLDKIRSNLVNGFRNMILNKLSALESVGPETKTVAQGIAEKKGWFSLLTKEFAAMGEKGQLIIPKIGDVVSFTGKEGNVLTGTIKEIVGQRATIEMAGRSVVATLSQLRMPETKEVSTLPGGGGIEQPPVKPPTATTEGQPTPEPEKVNVGKIISPKKQLQEELKNEDMLIRDYEKDISKLEEQIKLGEYRVENEKFSAQVRLETLKQKYAVAKEEQKQKKALRDEVAGLVKKVTAETPENIAIEYQGMIDQLKSKFDLKRRTEKTKAARESMKEYVERMKVEGRPIDIPEEKLAMLEKVNIEDMTLDQLRSINDTIKQLEKLGKTKLKAREAVYLGEKEKAKVELLKTATPISSKQLPKVPIGDKPKVWVERAIQLQNAAQKTGVGLTPIDGLADVTGMGPMKKELDADFSKYLTHNDKAIEDWYNLTKDFTDKEFQRIGVVAIARQEGGLQRLANSGITEEEVNAVELTPEEEKAYRFVVETFDKEYPAVKQYMKEVYNAEVGEQENYVSFMSDYEKMSDLEIYERFGQTPEQIANRKTKTVEKGFTKERTEVSKIKLETNIDKIFRRHMDDVAYMLNTGKNIKMYFEVINSPEIREKLGDVGTLAWLQWLDLMARKGGQEGAKRIAALDILRKNVGAGVLSFRLSSALVQFSSFADTIATIGAEWATKGATAISFPEWRNFIMDNFPEIKKAVGDDIAFREFGEGAMAKLANAGFKPLQFLDGLMRSTAAAGAYQKLALEKGIIIDLKNPNPELIAESTRLMRQSQGSSFFKDQPLAITAGYGLTDNRSVNKLILTFQSFMLSRWDNINRQIWRLGIKENNYKKAIASTFWLLIFAGAVEEGIRRGTRKVLGIISKDKRKEKPFTTSTVINIVQSVPLLGQIISAITYSSNPIPAINTIDEILTGAGGMVTETTKEAKLKNFIKMMGGIGAATGVPGSSQASQILRGLIKSKKRRKIVS